MIEHAGDGRRALGRWMDIRGIAGGDLDRAVIAEFRSARRASGMRWVPGAHGLDRLLEFLEEQGVRGRAVPAGGAGRGAGGALSAVAGGGPRAGRGHGRALCEAGAACSWPASGRSVSELEKPHRNRHCGVLAAESERLSVGSVKGRVAELRSLLRFLYLQGLTPRPLAAVVPPVAGWRDTGVPKAIPAGEVQLAAGQLRSPRPGRGSRLRDPDARGAPGCAVGRGGASGVG